MSPLIKGIVEMLQADIVSFGLLSQFIRQEDAAVEHSSEDAHLGDILRELLVSGHAVIGLAKLARADYVEFVAWRGEPEEVISRAMDAVSSANTRDKEFAFWVCAPESVDRYEESVNR